MGERAAAHWPWDRQQKPRVPLLKRALARTEQACGELRGGELLGAWFTGWIWKPGANVEAFNL